MHVVERSGVQRAVLLIHGYCQSSAYWTPTLGRLADAGAYAMAPDLPGFGASAKLPGPYTMEGYADALAHLLDERGLEQVVLVGGSLGGVVAQHFALRHPGRLLRLLLAATGAVTADPAAALAKADALAAAPWNEATVTPIVAGFFHRAMPAAELARYRAIALMASQPAAVAAARSNAGSRTLDRLAEITLPTLIIQGRHDRARTPEHGAEMRDRISGARLEVLDGSGHTPHLEEPDAFHALALPFLLA
ncbi:MAG: alpha/beta fold hydrolase [Alphaproteobacteria bacterium]